MSTEQEVNQTTTAPTGASEEAAAPGGFLGSLPADIREAVQSKDYWDDRSPNHLAVNAKVKAHFATATQKAAPEEEGRAPAPASEYDSFKPDLPESDRGELVALSQEAGIPAADLQRVVGEFYKLTSPGTRYQPVEPEAAMAELTKTWGGERDINLEITQQFVAARPALSEWLDATGLGNSPAVVQALYKLASRYAAEGDEAEKLLRSEAYRDSRHPDHAATFERVTRMFAKRYAGQRVSD